MGGITLECGCSFGRSLYGTEQDKERLIEAHLCQHHALLILKNKGIETMDKALGFIALLDCFDRKHIRI